MLEARGVSLNLGRREVLHGVDLALAPGEWLALLGPNGSGKSSLVQVLAGLYKPASGRVVLDDYPLGHYSAWQRGRLVGYLPQAVEMAEAMSVLEVIQLGRTPHLGLLGRPGAKDREAVAWALMVTGLEALADRQVEALSGGEFQRVLIARALAARPRYLLLDEPANSLDLHHQAALLGLIGQLRGEGVGILTVLHDPNLAMSADLAAFLSGGRRVALGKPREVLTPEVLERAYGGGVKVETTRSGRTVVLPYWP